MGFQVAQGDLRSQFQAQKEVAEQNVQSWDGSVDGQKDGSLNREEYIKMRMTMNKLSRDFSDQMFDLERLDDDQVSVCEKAAFSFLHMNLVLKGTFPPGATLEGNLKTLLGMKEDVQKAARAWVKTCEAGVT